MSNIEGKNKLTLCGTVVEPVRFSHESKDKEGEVKARYHLIQLKVKIITNKGILLDESVLPVIADETLLGMLERPIQIGDRVFIRGSWRMYTNPYNKKDKMKPVCFAKQIRFSDKESKDVNRFEVEGLLVDKLYKVERDEKGRMIRDEDGKIKPLLDEDGKKQWTVRVNKEKKIVNDYWIAINKNNRSFYLPCLSYYNLAYYIADEVPIKSRVKGSGYVRSRTYQDKNKQTQIAYEAVMVNVEKM